ncbi:MAG: peptide chain release factor N(5)-glutamine methyltransferase [Limnochordia bacterium]|jgi:release factor glutamine methyltransferase|nr:peptide chain release factor N(5)-glutamine methyltransferase [Limnochordia bacterium]
MGGQSRKVMELLTLSTEYLAKAGVDNPRLDAEVLLAHCLGLERIWLYVYYNRPVTEAELNCYRRLISRRAKHWPVAYLIGHREFMSLSLEVNQHVLIPRPETEILVQSVLEWVSTNLGDTPVRVIDLGTGSGAIAVSIAHALPKALVLGLDISEQALDLARRNARRHDVLERCLFVQSDLFSDTGGFGPAHLIVSNPPYIPISMWETLSRDVREYEPEMALKAGADGLDFYRRILQEAPPHLEDGGLLFLEIGQGQREHICNIAKALGFWSFDGLQKDYAGIERVLAFRKK